MKVWWQPRSMDTAAGRHLVVCGTLLVVLALGGLSLGLLLFLSYRGFLAVVA